MKTKSTGIAGVAAIALLGTVALSRVALAQDWEGNPPQYSSPDERAQTRQLNMESLNGTTQTPAVLNGEERPTPGSMRAVTNGTIADQQYDQRLQDYQDEQEQYQNERAQYEDRLRGYSHRLRWYDQARWDYDDYPNGYAYDYDAAEPIYSVRRDLTDVPVEGPDGEWVGEIRDMRFAPDGRPVRVEISLNRRVAVWVDAGDFRFDPRENVAYTDVSRDALWDMPDAVVVTNPM